MFPSFLTDQKLEILFFGGKGGVGKTTCATATAFSLALNQPDASFLLVSTDPAHSLKDIDAADSPPDNLLIHELDAHLVLDQFKEDHQQDLRDIATRGTFLDDEDIDQFLALSLPGLDELMAFLEICRWAETHEYSRIVVDSAPTGHTLRLLALPEFSTKWLEALDTLLAKSRYMKKTFHGSYSPDHCDQFLTDLSASVQNLNEILQDSRRFRFVPVVQAESLSIRETLQLTHELKTMHIPYPDIVCNGIYPDLPCPVCAARRSSQFRQLQELLKTELAQSSNIWLIPQYSREINSHQDLHQFWTQSEALQKENFSQIPSPETPEPAQSRVENPFPLPAQSTRFLFFAGKGGVGKTTLACASALRFSQDIENRAVFLFSTDPAHSLSDCLDVAVGPKPSLIQSNLTAMEIDAQAEFDSLKNEYADELQHFLQRFSSNLDLTFDREVMERIMDLSPPGLDEIMALLQAMEIFEKDQYDLLIFDSAPTGHLIRLLESPEIIDQWLKAFFNIFLKYKAVFRLPKISKRMVHLSKLLRRFQDLLGSQEQASLIGVTILTKLAFEETKDLAAACKRAGLHQGGLFMNQVTPDSDCSFCQEIALQEQRIQEQCLETFAVVPQATVYRSVQDLRGLSTLHELGQSLWK